ncbi:hypothetical protein Hypma_010424 [Hypsizygus marmoreus]|uniref:Uncharacterized protein n=1 Tax=Hypsizygus marmoreus TaxID=39966 RepID=A0A369JPV5_HYPMA|nr:hypothetical protein Hypma_010424 [Hypsizygus marmoreus]
MPPTRHISAPRSTVPTYDEKDEGNVPSSCILALASPTTITKLPGLSSRSSSGF